MTPQRIQLRRTKGYRKPEGAVVVSRPSKWGNPFRVYRCDCCGHWDVIDENGVTYLISHGVARSISPTPRGEWEATQRSVGLFAELYGGLHERDPADVVAALAGRDLACWCKLDAPCHADVLLEIANGEAS